MSGPRVGSLFSGYGGLEQGVQAVLGGSIAWHSEIDPGACKILAHRYPDVPNHGDITNIDWASVEPVDVLTGGSPCQDLSAAGKRAGMTEGTRSNLWVSMREAIAQLHPGLVVWENVRGALSARASSDMELAEGRLGTGDDGPFLRALGRVLGDLADLGYDASWQGLRASDVGAPHGRFRVFVVAWPAQDAHLAAGDQRRFAASRQAQARWSRTNPGGQGGAPTPDSDRNPVRVQPDGLTRCRGEAVFGHAGSNAAAHPDRYGLIGKSGPPSRRNPLRDDQRDDPDRRHDGAAADPLGGGRAGRPHESVGLSLIGASAAGGGPSFGAWGPYGDAVLRWELVTRPAPAPTELGAKGAHRLSPAFVEWLMGLPVGWVTDVPGLSRNEQLKALGNGVVPQQAAEALRLLLPDVEAVAA